MRLGVVVGGRYRLVEGPMRGGNGEVWRAHDTELGRDVVLKRSRGGDDSAGFDRLRAEARALARFSHPHVVTLYDAVRVTEHGESASWLVMEYVPGGSLDNRPLMRPEQAARTGAQIAEALAALHAEGIVHGDVKPANVVATGDVLTGGGTAKLADFGAAYRFGAQETITPNSAISYTPDYAAPEVVRGQPEPRSDVFSLGALVYALATGQPPRRGGRDEPGEQDTFVAKRAAARDAVHLDAGIGPLSGVLAAMLRFDARARPDAAEASRLLAEVAGAAAPAPGSRTAATGRAGRIWSRVPRFVRRRPVLSAGAAAVVTLAVVLALIPFTGDDSQDAKPRSEQAAGSSVPEGAGASPVLGDPRTADPCSLTRPSAFARFGSAELDEDYGNFDRCDVVLSAGDTEVVDVEVSMSGSGSPAGSGSAEGTRSRAGVRIEEAPEESEACVRLLTVDGAAGTTFVVQAKQLDEPEKPLCDIADTAADTAADRLGRGELPRRSPAPPKDSLLYRDACSMLDAGALSAVPGIDAADPETGFGGWDCAWRSTTSKLEVDVQFNRPWLPNADDGSTTRLGGHQAVVLPEDEGPGSCVVEVAGPSYKDRYGEKSVETLRVTVTGGRAKDRPCTLVTGLARSAAAGLPSR